MKFILIPVKDLTRAKQRLAELMTQAERTELARRMMAHSFAQVAAARGCDGVAVVTMYGPAIELARRYDFEIIAEAEQISESASVDYGSRVLAGRKVSSVLRLPIDLPLISSQDIEQILSRIAEARSVVMVPSRDRTGTNAIGRTPPDLFPSHFGPDSLLKHEAEARKQKAAISVIELPRVALDIDDPADLACLLEYPDSSLHDYLKNRGIAARLLRKNII
jgi:2-phospho-L-lactate guanylyltransferase